MKVKFKFHMPVARHDEIVPEECTGCESIDELKHMLLDEAEMPAWDVTVDADDLAALWAEVRKVQDEAA